MATKNFTQFSTTTLTTGDYIVGYKADASAELKTTVQSIINLVQDSDNQTLSFNENSKDLTITSGNTVSLSALVDSSVDTGVRALTGNWQDTYTTVQNNSASWEESADITAITTTVASNSGNWNQAYNVATTYQQASGFWQAASTITSLASANTILAGGNTRTSNITIGTNDPYHLGLETDNTARVTILSSGDVGIGTTIAETQSPVIESIINGNFSDLTGLNPRGGGWFDGVPAGWIGNTSFFTIFSQGSNYVANISTLASGSGSSSFRQRMGVLKTTSNVVLTFDYAAAGFSNGTLNAAIYDSNFNVLATNSYTNAYGTYTLSASSVPADTEIIVGFWRTAGTPALDNVSITSKAVNSFLTVNGGISASEKIFSADKQVVTTSITNVPGVSAITTILAVSALPVTQEPGVLYILV
jgi:hypothetical protein